MSTTSTKTQPSSSVAMTSQAETDTRQLTFEVLTKSRDKLDALKLVADSVAQQRQSASAALIFHPICLSTLVAVISAIHLSIASVREDYSSMMLTYSGIILTYLLAIRYATGNFILVAEDTDWSNWLRNEKGVDDLVLGARFGSEIVATIVLRLPSVTTRSKASSNSKAVIRAWTTRLRYRGRGLGGDMLREAVNKSKDTLGPKGTVEFAEDHANSSLPSLPDTFNAIFFKRQQRAKNALSAAVQSWEAQH